MYLRRRDSFNDNCYQDAFDNTWHCDNSAWNDWVRWVVLAVVIVIFFLLFVACSCITSRRRRRMGQQPFYGTGWASRPGQAAPYYHSQPAPPYSAEPPIENRNHYGNTNNTPYYSQQGGYELQSPTPAYHGTGYDQYAPPAGPPPGKQHDGVIR